MGFDFDRCTEAEVAGVGLFCGVVGTGTGTETLAPRFVTGTGAGEIKGFGAGAIGVIGTALEVATTWSGVVAGAEWGVGDGPAVALSMGGTAGSGATVKVTA